MQRIHGEFIPVEIVAFQRKEQATGRDIPAVGRNDRVL
jgi:hypothetical protein